MNSCLTVDDMFVHVNWMINCCWYWTHMSKIIYVNMLCFWWKSNEWWSGVLLNLEWIHGYLMLMMFETCCWWIGVMIMSLVNWWWKLLFMLNIYESLVKFWIWINWCLIHEFWAFLSMCLGIWPINIIWDEFWV